jgi:hypothetical protein
LFSKSRQAYYKALNQHVQEYFQQNLVLDFVAKIRKKLKHRVGD